MVRKFVLALVVLLVAIQLVPYGRDHSNPPVTMEPRWNSAETKATFERVCGDCHSHKTRWPWYSYVAPVSWLVQRDVDEGRSEFNVSNSEGGKEAHEAAEMVLKGKMPLKQYLPAHPEARLTEEEKQAFAVGLDATFGKGRAGGGDDDDESLGEKSGYLD